MLTSSSELILLGVEVTDKDLGVELVAADDDADPSNSVAPSPLTLDTSEHGGDGRSSCVTIGGSSIALDSESESVSTYFLFIIRLKKKRKKEEEEEEE